MAISTTTASGTSAETGEPNMSTVHEPIRTGTRPTSPSTPGDDGRDREAEAGERQRRDRQGRRELEVDGAHHRGDERRAHADRVERAAVADVEHEQQAAHREQGAGDHAQRRPLPHPEPGGDDEQHRREVLDHERGAHRDPRDGEEVRGLGAGDADAAEHEHADPVLPDEGPPAAQAADRGHGEDQHADAGAHDAPGARAPARVEHRLHERAGHPEREGREDGHEHPPRASHAHPVPCHDRSALRS